MLMLASTRTLKIMEACARIRARPRCCWKRHRMRFFSRSTTASLSEWRFATASAASVSHFSVVSVISPCVPEPSGVKAKPGGPVPSVYFLIFFFSAFSSSFSGAPTAPPVPAPSAMKLSVMLLRPVFGSCSSMSTRRFAPFFVAVAAWLGYAPKRPTTSFVAVRPASLLIS